MKRKPLLGSFYYLRLSFIKSQPLRGSFRTCLYGPALLCWVTCPRRSCPIMESVAFVTCLRMGCLIRKYCFFVVTLPRRGSLLALFIVNLPRRGSLLIEWSVFFVTLPRRGFLLIETADSLHLLYPVGVFFPLLFHLTKHISIIIFDAK